MANALSVDNMEMRVIWWRDSINKDELLSSLSPARVNPHSDGGGLAILLQANQVEGLQIKKDEQWIPVRPLPNAFIINFGDMIEVIIFYWKCSLHI